MTNDESWWSLMWQEPRDAMTAVVRQRVPALSGDTWCLLSYPKVLVTLSSFDSNVHTITNLKC